MVAWTGPLLIVYVFAVGAAVGSFLNVLIHRLPRHESIVRPRSHCPSCGQPIRWYDNLPLASWILLGARCRHCRASISMRYPAVEAAGGLVAVLGVLRYGLSVAGLEAVLFAWLSITLGVIDLEHQLLPDVLTYPAVVLGVAGAFAGGLTSPLESLLGLVVGAGLPVLVIVLYKAVRGIEGMGWGDVKYLAAIGAVVGVQTCLWVLILAAVIGALVGLGLVATGRGSGRTPLPFGTFLAVAVLVWLYLPPAWRFWVAL